MAQAGITPPATVRLLCNYAEPRLSNPNTKFFEPGCGDGNILIEVLARRLEKVSHHQSAVSFQNEILLAVSNLYGVDVRPAAVSETRYRLQVYTANFATQYSQLDYRFIPLLEHILQQNFFVANLLQNLSEISFPSWQRIRDFEFKFTLLPWPTEIST